MTLVVLIFYLNWAGFSPLKGHKKNHNFVNTPSEICDCGGCNEDTIHFFNECALFATISTKFLSSTSNILINNNFEHVSQDELTQLYLYGHYNLGKTQSSTSMIPSVLHDPN